jgi:hypothetical protein
MRVQGRPGDAQLARLAQRTSVGSAPWTVTGMSAPPTRMGGVADLLSGHDLPLDHPLLDQQGPLADVPPFESQDLLRDAEAGLRALVDAPNWD